MYLLEKAIFISKDKIWMYNKIILAFKFFKWVMKFFSFFFF